MLVPAAPADSCWASAIVTTLGRAPLLAAPRLARLVCAALDGCA